MAVKDLIEVKNLSKRFPGVLALDCINFSARQGEVHVLLGENGAGKSTLSKVIAGVHQPDGGEIFIDGEVYSPSNIRDARESGISMIFQELQLVPHLSVTENIFLGRELKGRFRIDMPAMRKRAKEMIKKFGVAIDVDAPVKDLSVAQMQMVEIIKALSFESKILIMDEPTASLTESEIKELFRIVSELKQQGLCIIYISHRMEEFFEIGDRVTVLRDGQFVDTVNISDVDIDRLIHLMVGRELKEQYPKEIFKKGEEVLSVKNLSQKKNGLNDISFNVCKGEIVGFAGLVGAGRSELMRAIFGADSFEEGEILMHGKVVKIKDPKDAVELGIAFLSEDRKYEGLNLIMGIDQNVSLASLDKITKFFKMSLGRERSNSAKQMKSLRIKATDGVSPVKNLSGGNQQKVVIAKWLESFPQLFIFDEPTRGIDVGAKVEIYRIMNQLVKDGAAVIMISSDMPEVLGMSDRIYVMYEGEITGELSSADASQLSVMRLASLSKSELEDKENR